MGKLAITGGESLRKTPFPAWPTSTKEESLALEDVLTSTKWGGQPFPGKHSVLFAKRFAELHTAKYAQCVNTGTVAIQASLKAIGIRPYLWKRQQDVLRARACQHFRFGQGGTLELADAGRHLQLRDLGHLVRLDVRAQPRGAARVANHPRNVFFHPIRVNQ